MECRLCLRSITAESFVSIHDNPRPVVQHIWNCCQLQATKNDGLSDLICVLCDNTLELLSAFRKICIQNYEKSKSRLDKCLNIKTEEIILEDLKWEESDVNSQPNFCYAPVNDEMNEWGSSVSEGSDSKQNIHLIESIDSPIRVGNFTSCGYGAEIPAVDDAEANEPNDIELSLEEPTLPETLHEKPSLFKSDQKISLNEMPNVAWNLQPKNPSPIDCDVYLKAFAQEDLGAPKEKEHAGIKNTRNPIPLEYILSGRSRPKLIDQGFLFIKDRKVEDKTFWRCDQYLSQHCRARLHVVDETIVRRVGEHSHSSNSARIEAVKTLQSIKDKAITTQHGTHQLLTESCTGLSEAVISQMPNDQNVKKMIRRTRNNTRFPIPSFWPICNSE
ncbi:uncharacterized protein LOC143920537 [Arctopsyche grandis]|uniref:uncharacterized protein LOC143920537 n=1 Tax=Arctopsyche grandis TaxID=121162 RepID=UPI00406D838B